MQHVNCGRTALLTYRGPFADSLSPRNVNACRRLASRLVIHRLRCPTANAFAQLRSRRPVSADVTTVRTAFVAEPPHSAFPALPSLRPGGSGVGVASLAFLARSAGRHPATGLRHAATSVSPSFSDLSTRGGIVPKIATTSCRRFAPVRASVGRQMQAVGIPPKSMAGILPTNEKGHLAVASLGVVLLRCIG